MVFSKYNKDRPFLIAERFLSPSKEKGKNREMITQEQVSIETCVKNKHIESATVIIDVLQRKLVKSRFDEDEETVVKHYLSHYKDKVAEGIQIWMNSSLKNKETMKQFAKTLEEELDKTVIDIDIEDTENIALDEGIIKVKENE